MKIEIHHVHRNAAVEIYLFEEGQRGTMYYEIQENGIILGNEIDNLEHATNLKPFLSCPARFFDKFVQALITDSESRGVMSVNQNHTEGKLQATERHLFSLESILNKLLPSDEKVFGKTD